MKCIFEIFDKEAPSGLFFGLLLIVIGCFWFLNLKNSVMVASWVSGFFVSGLVGIILISGGIRILLKPPLRSWVAGAVIIILVISLITYGPSHKNTASYFDFLDNITIHNFWNQGWLHDSSFDNNNADKFQYFGQLSDKNLTLLFKKANVTIRNEEIDKQFGVKGALSVKSVGTLDYEVESQPNDDLDLVINPKLQDLFLVLNVGNLSGTIKEKMNQVVLRTDTGNVRLTCNNAIGKMTINTNMGNVHLNIYEPVDNIVIESNIGNIEIHAKKGIFIDILSLDSKVGNTTVPNSKDDSKGICRLKAKLDIGNITIVNDL
jgi:hypothetical protein